MALARAEMVRDLVANGHRDLVAQRVRIAAVVTHQRVPADHDHMAPIACHRAADVQAVGAVDVPIVGDRHSDVALELDPHELRELVERVGDETRKAVGLARLVPGGLLLDRCEQPLERRFGHRRDFTLWTAIGLVGIVEPPDTDEHEHHGGEDEPRAAGDDREVDEQDRADEARPEHDRPGLGQRVAKLTPTLVATPLAAPRCPAIGHARHAAGTRRARLRRSNGVLTTRRSTARQRPDAHPTAGAVRHGQLLRASRRWSRSCAASSTALWRHSAAR